MYLTAKADEKPPEPVKKDKIVKSEPEVKQETIKKEPSPAKRYVVRTLPGMAG